MTYSKRKLNRLSDSEWSEMNALKEAINQLPQSVSPDKMEKFTEYFVRSLKENGQ
jgi:uncharacterized membrane protein